MKTIVLLASLAIAGCAGTSEPQWERPAGTTEAQARRDMRQCMYEAEKAVPDTSYTGMSTAIGSVIAQERAKFRIIKACARARGYHRPGEA